eukprot:1803940-Rhodomonas_salina.5
MSLAYVAELLGTDRGVWQAAITAATASGAYPPMHSCSISNPDSRIVPGDEQACVNAHFNLGNILYKQRKFSDAAASFHAVLKLRDNDVQALNNLGLALSGVPTYLCLRKCCECPMKLTPHDDVLDQGEKEAALESFSAAAALDTEDPVALTNQANVLADLYWRTKKPQGVVQTLLSSYARARERSVLISLIQLLYPPKHVLCHVLSLVKRIFLRICYEMSDTDVAIPSEKSGTEVGHATSQERFEVLKQDTLLPGEIPSSKAGYTATRRGGA